MGFCTKLNYFGKNVAFNIRKQSTWLTFPPSSLSRDDYGWMLVLCLFGWRKSAIQFWINTKIYSVHCSTTLHRVFLYIKVEFEPSFLPIGKPGRKASPVDCIITHKNCTFEPKTKFTQTATWHGKKVKSCCSINYLETNPIEQCGASASEDRDFRRCWKVLPTIVWCVEREPRFRCGVWAAKIFCLLSSQGTFSSPKRGWIYLQVEVDNPFQPKI